MWIKSLVASLVLFSLVGHAAMPGAGPASFSFGLWGDMPYTKAGDDSKLPAVLQSINQSDITFSIYHGDIKDGSSKCTDDVYTDALAMFSKMVKPVVYVPGDNEWTDCHRVNNGGYDTLERLAHLRKAMCMATRIISSSTSRFTARPSCCPTSLDCKPSVAHRCTGRA